jgi:hypothetical protein
MGVPALISTADRAPSRLQLGEVAFELEIGIPAAGSHVLD